MPLFEDEVQAKRLALFYQKGEEYAMEDLLRVCTPILNFYTARRPVWPGHDKDDMLQVGRIAIWEAAKVYDPEKGPFLPFAALCIRRRLITAKKHAYAVKNLPLICSFSISSAMPANNLNSEQREQWAEPGHYYAYENTLYANDLAADEARFRREKTMMLKILAYHNLTSLEARVLWIYLQGNNYNDIVKIMNEGVSKRKRVTWKTIDNSLCRIFRKTRELERQGFYDAVWTGKETTA